MSGPRGRGGWVCHPCDLSRKKAWNAKVARSKGRESYLPRSGAWARKRRPDEIADGRWRALEERNARDAWRYWIKVKAPRWWHAAAAKTKAPWKDRSLPAAERYRLRYRHDPNFAVQERLRIWARKLKRQRVDERLRVALKKGLRSKALEELLGYSVEDLRRHLERQFSRKMSWEAFARGDIHIDHRRPLSSFDLSDPDQFSAAWALTNLQPMWAGDNIKKGNKLVVLL